MLQFGNIGWFHIGCCGPRELRQRELPLRCRKADTARLLVEVAEMLVDCGIGLIAFDGLAQILFGEFVLAELEVDSAQ